MDSAYLGLVIYLVLILAVGAFTWKMNRTKEDFIIGGRRLGAWVIALSERTAAESSWLLLGLSGAVFWLGKGELWTVFGCVAGIFFSWKMIAHKLREESEACGAITLPEFLFQRAGGQANLVRVVSMLIIVFFFSFYVGAQFIGAGKVLNATFGIPQFWGMVLGAVVTGSYAGKPSKQQA
jgi:sodium/proline symporter